MIALSARVVREVGGMTRHAIRDAKRLPVLGIDADVRIASPADRAAFGEELTEAVTRLVAKYHDGEAPDGRWGNAGWLFPAEIEEREGGSMAIRRAPFGDDAPATVTAHEPPRRFAYEEEVGPDTPPWATEFLVEGRAGGTTVVRVVTGFHEGGESWEPMVEGAGEGWAGALEYLRIYVANFLGRPASGIGATGDTGRSLSERPALSAELLGALQLSGLEAGDKYRAPDHAAPLAGVVETDAVGDG